MPRTMLCMLIVLIAGFAVTASACPKTSEAGLPMIPVRVEGTKVLVEVVVTDAQRARGLMYRRSMRDDRGMLFVYPKKQVLSFWMKNTFIPLTIAFLDDEGAIVNLEDMKPQTEASHRSRTPVRYALEMNKGWFEERGIQPGDKIVFELPEDLEIR